jgi:hypothetical protein
MAERIADGTRCRRPTLVLFVDQVTTKRERIRALLAAIKSSTEPKSEVDGARCVRLTDPRSANVGKYP